MASELLSAWADQAFAVCWQTALLAGLIWLITRAFRKLTPATKTWLWWAVMLKAVVGFVALPPILLPLLPPPSNPYAQVNDRMDLLAPVVHGPGVNQPLSANPVPARRSEAESPSPWLILLGTLWAAGLVAHAGHWTWDAIRVRRLVKGAKSLSASEPGQMARQVGVAMGLPASPRILESDGITAPMVVGIFRPVVLLPAGMAESLAEPELRMVLAHELAHLRRRDLVLAIVPALAQALLFFWPAQWLAQREWSIEREVACDTEAIGATESDPNRYGQLLLKIVTRDHRGGLTPVLGATASYHTLRKRLSMMKESMIRPSRRLRAAGIALTALGMLLVLPWQVSARAALVQNEIANAGFEEGFASWTRGSLPQGADSGVAYEIDKKVAHSGAASLMLSKGGNRFFPIGTLWQDIKIPAGARRLKLSMWVKAENVRKLTMKVTMAGGENAAGWGAYVGESEAQKGPSNHDWKKFGSVWAIPSGTGSATIEIQMYGSGTAWVDDVSAEFVSPDTPVQEAVAMGGAEDNLDDVKDITNEEIKIGNDSMQRYFLIGADKKEVPAAGYKLLIVMPGGDGSADFNPFVRRMKKYALPKEYIVAELVAPKWSDDQFSQIVWPTRKVRWQGMKFSTEEFIAAVVKDVKSRVAVDDAHVYSLSWSSSGPAAYAESLSGGPVKGSFIAMSVYQPNNLGSFSAAKGHAYYLLHSPEDFIKISMPQQAVKDLKAAGARVKLQTYAGGHGWHGDIFTQIKDGVAWLESGS